MIWYDPTEGRVNTRLPQGVIERGSPLGNLETYTGADLLVTPFGVPIKLADISEDDVLDVASAFYTGKSKKYITEETGIPLPKVIGMERLWNACQMGMLIQRKSGMDYVNSIHRLDEIFGRMKVWTPDPVLLISGQFGDIAGKAAVDGRRTEYTYKAIIAKQASWSLSGGIVFSVPTDDHITPLIEYLDKKLYDVAENRIKTIVRRRMTRQIIVGPNDKRWTWMAVLVDLPGIGDKKARAIADYCGNLANSIMFLTDPDALSYEGAPDILRPSDIKKVRKLFGLAPGVKLDLTSTGEEK